MFGSNHEAFRPLKLVPGEWNRSIRSNIELERRRTLAQLKYGPWIARRRLNRRGREVLFEVLIQSFAIRSCVIIPNEERNTRLGLICQATPTRG